MYEPNHPITRTLGVAQVRVAGRFFALPVQAMDFAGATSDAGNTSRPMGGFFVEGETMGILVDQSADEQQIRAQVLAGCAAAVRHLSAKLLS